MGEGRPFLGSGPSLYASVTFVCVIWLLGCYECSFGLLVASSVGLRMLPCAGVGSVKLWLCLVALQGPGADTCTFPLGAALAVLYISGGCRYPGVWWCFHPGDPSSWWTSGEQTPVGAEAVPRQGSLGAFTVKAGVSANVR